jgi:NAD(P)-dependent dehydrogenase (short-subunit alcohol dehydrogenase family)
MSPTHRRSVVVTGAGAGAGRAIAERFGREGWRVGLISRDRARLEAAKATIEAAGGEALVLPADVSDPAAVFAARDQALEAWGGLDAWVNAAMATVVGPIDKIAPEEFRRVTEVTYLGCVHGTQAALEPMRRAGRGAIVQVGSALAYRAIPLQSAYCASKFAIRGFTDSLRAELRRERCDIRLSMVQMPGMDTPQFDWARNHFPLKYQPVGDTFDPEVAAEAVTRAIRTGAREYWVGGSAIQAILGQFASPTLMDAYLARTAWDGQLTDTPEPPGRPDNLFQTVQGDQGARGRFGDRAKPHAFILDPEQARLVLGAASLALGGLATARAFRRR